MVSVCLPSDALLQHLLSYLGFSYLGRGLSLHGCSSKEIPLVQAEEQRLRFAEAHTYSLKREVVPHELMDIVKVSSKQNAKSASEPFVGLFG